MYTQPAPRRPFARPSPRIVRPLLYAGGMIPAVWLFALALTDQLGADPMKTLEQDLGLWALRFLIAALCVTPLRQLGGPSLLPYRRALGLLAFFYALLHVAVYTGLDQGFVLAAIGRDILKRPYIMAGLLAFAILVPLAVTSNSAMIKRLGTAWQKLHRWVYLAAAAAALHFLLSVKAWPAEPVIYAAIVAALLAPRLFRRSRRRARSTVPGT